MSGANVSGPGEGPCHPKVLGGKRIPAALGYHTNFSQLSMRVRVGLLAETHDGSVTMCGRRSVLRHTNKFIDMITSNCGLQAPANIYRRIYRDGHSNGGWKRATGLRQTKPTAKWQ